MQQAGVFSAAMLMSGGLTAGGKKRKVGLQLYTLRDYIGKDVSGVIKKVAEAGYVEVEVFGYSRENGFWGEDAQAFHHLLEENRLSAPSGHYGIDSLLSLESKEDDLRTAIETGKVLGHSYITVPYLDERFRKSSSDYKKIAAKFNKAAAICKEEGFKLAYHNHSFEFEPLDGTTGYDILLQETDPQLVKFELDIYWAVRGGKDPVAMFREHPHRFTMWHVKDMDRTKRELNTEVGKGSIDFKKIFAASKTAGLEHAIVEQENFSIGWYESIKESCNYIKSIV